MKRRIDKSTLTVRIAEQIKHDVLQGLWITVLPGYRSLASYYDVSINTIRAALPILEQWSVIEPAVTGKRREISAKSKSMTPKDRKKRLLHISDDSRLMDQSSFRLIQEMTRTWETRGGEATHINLDYFRFKKPERKLKKLIKEYRPDGLLLRFPTAQWSGYAAGLKPTFIVGGSHPTDVPVTTVGSPLKNEIQRIISRLAKLGHQQIMIASPESSPDYFQAMVDGIANGLGLSTLTVQKQGLVQVCHEEIPAVWTSYWQRIFRQNRPTAVVLLGNEHWLSLSGYCSQHNIRIPEDLSVFLFNYDENLTWCNPQPNMARFPEKQLLAIFRKWMKGGLRPLGKIDLKTEEVAGGTVTPLHTSGIIIT